MRTVGEGVEREADRECLRALGCDVVQGYLVARPMPAAGLAEWIAGLNARKPLALPGGA
jgi:EAL domain-containing protein (putative c-di-GMP-specific phosphodiesterase class I)